MLAYIYIFLLGLVQTNQVSSFILSPAQQCILKDVSWKLKVQFLNNIFPPEVTRRDINTQALVLPITKTNHLKNDELKKRNVGVQFLTVRKKNVQLVKELKRNVAIDFLVKGPISPKQSQRIDDESSMSFEEKSDSKNLDFEALGVHDGLQTDHNTDLNKNLLYRRQDNPPPGREVVSHHVDEAETERDMKLKLFRLMYDTVKDNDELVRKADGIKKKYDNSSYFEIGFIMGAITDKVNTMSSVALTVERLYDEWKPIEHVNAYEQIANQAIEINHFVDILQSTHKKTEAAAAKEHAKPTTPAALRQDYKLNDYKDVHDLKSLKEINRLRRARNLDRTL